MLLRRNTLSWFCKTPLSNSRVTTLVTVLFGLFLSFFFFFLWQSSSLENSYKNIYSRYYFFCFFFCLFCFFFPQCTYWNVRTEKTECFPSMLIWQPTKMFTFSSSLPRSRKRLSSEMFSNKILFRPSFHSRFIIPFSKLFLKMELVNVT